MKISAGRRHANSLEHGMLNSKTFEDLLKKLLATISHEKKTHFAFIDALMFNIYCTGLEEKVMRWIKKLNILEKKYVIVPIVMWSHWRVMIMCNFHDESTEQTILILDSLQSMKQSIETEIRRFVLSLLKMEGRDVNKDLVRDIPIKIPKVPQQINGEECGWFALQYVYLFIQNAPDAFSLSQEFPYFRTSGFNASWNIGTRTSIAQCITCQNLCVTFFCQLMIYGWMFISITKYQLQS